MNQADITQLVQQCLAEDLNLLSSDHGDISASLIPEKNVSVARIISREPAIFCGIEWGNEVFRQLGNRVILDWHVKDGDFMEENQCVCTLSGPSRDLLTGERTLLNIAQTLSGTATTTRSYVDVIEGTGVRLLDTRKTIPGMRNAQKYAVACGGGVNHRFGLYDAFLIKENHIAAAGSIQAAVSQAKTSFPSKPVEVEVENLDELQQALNADTDRIMLDNFSLDLMREAVAINAGKAELEASGNVNLTTIRHIADTGVDFISVGALTKHIAAVDFSMRFTD
ncbi:carboxylating nicotinate-nucleotide diphosphorylase [Echinimonas agarilytica]|uniref:nicotinate-nucleotide diphosphorylase (carboxylating) n=1 Tax=Echinimonas agarilytica TaxID=1215918 RepID=A0AA41W5A2_9GAMM|nr:carboxylating nicotinate-nucleotide diphosphorylase [Echinimonas agarilytica]MCM2678797.1 carboxylating nicotinate-nucleotide diphosphorylase [Echinimonas agarilytica]